jgi:hypothetical protein
MHVDDFADGTLADEFAEAHDARMEMELEANSQVPVHVARAGNHLGGLIRIHAEGLFAQDVRSRTHCRQALGGVKIVRRSDDHHIGASGERGLHIRVNHHARHFGAGFDLGASGAFAAFHL